MTCCSGKKLKAKLPKPQKGKERKSSKPCIFFRFHLWVFWNFPGGYDKYGSPAKASNKTINWINRVELLLQTSSNLTLIHPKGIEDNPGHCLIEQCTCFNLQQTNSVDWNSSFPRRKCIWPKKIIVDFRADHVRLPESRSSSERDSYRLSQIIEDIAWNYPPPSNSHHQKYYVFFARNPYNNINIYILCNNLCLPLLLGGG